jgi:predicted enzyme related to lactoylglutathione lyase
MTSQLTHLGFEANDPLRLAQFWAEALRWDVGDQTGEQVALVPTDSTRFGIVFRRTPEIKSGQNRNHLDLTTVSIDDQMETVARLLELGANHIDIGQSAGESHVVLADPEGNEFCVLAPGNSFLAGCERLGAINCDGSKQTGYFWSAALGWPLVWDQDEETAVRAPDGTGPLVTWSGPPLIPKHAKNRLYLDLTPTGDRDVELERLVALGARNLDIGQHHVDWVVLADPDGNEFCVLARQR